tara:strand:- start:22 stop:381 length:360 start_codon:yes stop_codon:yes gene_type:complete
MKRSKCKLSDQLDVFVYMARRVGECLLDNEKLTLINEAGEGYDELISMASTDYFLEEEYEFLTSTVAEWNIIIKEDAKRHRNISGSKDMPDDMKEAWDDFMKTLKKDLRIDDEDEYEIL